MLLLLHLVTRQHWLHTTSRTFCCGCGYWAAGLYRVQSAAAVLLDLLPQQHVQAQQQRRHEQPAEGCSGTSLVSTTKEPSPSLGGLLDAAFPEWQQQHKMEEQQPQEASLQHALHQQQQLLLQQQSGLVFALLLELACRGSPKCVEWLGVWCLVGFGGKKGVGCTAHGVQKPQHGSLALRHCVLCYIDRELP